MSNQMQITFEQKETASTHITRAIHAMQAPQNGNLFGPSTNELVALSEPNRIAALLGLLSAAMQLIPDNHPDAVLRARLETWLNSQH